MTKNELIIAILDDDMISITENFEDAQTWFSNILRDGFVGYAHRNKTELENIALGRGIIEKIFKQLER